MKTDFIITWVDGSDPLWRAEFNKYSPIKKESEARYRDWDTLKYVLRGIEKFTPWVNKIHFVTMGHKPVWLNTNHPKLNFLTHNDIFLNKNHLPVFNSISIEMNFLGIKNLENQFVLFNDDHLILKPLNQEEFFKDGLPRDFLIQSVLKDFLSKKLFPSNLWVWSVDYTLKIINKDFNKKESVRMYRDKYINKEYGLLNNIRNIWANLFKRFFLFEHYHHPQPYLREVWQEVFNKHKEEILETSSHKFRQKNDIIHYIFRYYQLVTGRFIPRYKKDFITINIKSAKEANECVNKMDKYTFMCINDVPELSESDYKKSKKIVIDALDLIMPEKSAFEL